MWWPLAASWMMMAVELPAVSAIMARLANPEVHLAAYGGVVFPLALMIEAPVIMLLAASTALSTSWKNYLYLRRFTVWLALAMTLLHALIVFTPLFDLIVVGAMKAPEAIRAPARLGLIIMIPWTAAIAYRRFQQGVLILYNRSQLVGVGTAVRLVAMLGTLGVGYAVGGTGIVVGTVAVVLGVTAEAIFASLAVIPVLDRVRARRHQGDNPNLPDLLRFYVPLAMTSMITLMTLPLVSAGLGRMPMPMHSLAVWPVMNGLVFAFRSLGHSYNEVVVALMQEPGAEPALRRFTRWLTIGMSVPMIVLVVTPLGWIWFHGVSGLPEHLARLGTFALWFALLLPGMSVIQNYLQGMLVHLRRTRGITESVGVGLSSLVFFMGLGIVWGEAPGLAVVMVSITAAGAMQVGWLRFRANQARRARETPPSGEVPPAIVDPPGTTAG